MEWERGAHGIEELLEENDGAKGGGCWWERRGVHAGSSGGCWAENGVKVDGGAGEGAEAFWESD